MVWAYAGMQGDVGRGRLPRVKRRRRRQRTSQLVYLNEEDDASSTPEAPPKEKGEEKRGAHHPTRIGHGRAREDRGGERGRRIG